MKIGRLRRLADELATEARSDRLQFKSHAEQALVIVRLRMGSTAGLAISFSLGFMAGTRSSNGRTAGPGRNRSDGSGRKSPGPTFMHRLAHGPAGEAAMKLGMAFLARSLLKLQEEDIADGSPGTADIADRSASGSDRGNQPPVDPGITSDSAATGSSVK